MVDKPTDAVIAAAVNAPIFDLVIRYAPTMGQLSIKWPDGLDDGVKIMMLGMAFSDLIEQRAVARATNSAGLVIPQPKVKLS